MVAFCYFSLTPNEEIVNWSQTARSAGTRGKKWLKKARVFQKDQRETLEAGPELRRRERSSGRAWCFFSFTCQTSLEAFFAGIDSAQMRMFGPCLDSMEQFIFLAHPAQPQLTVIQCRDPAAAILPAALWCWSGIQFFNCILGLNLIVQQIFECSQLPSSCQETGNYF